MIAFLSLIYNVIEFYKWILILAVVVSWLVQFKILDTSNRFVYLAADILYKATEPALRPIRRFIPSLGGLDISPVLLIFALIFLQDLIAKDIFPSLV